MALQLFFGGKLIGYDFYLSIKYYEIKDFLL
jgi:hypothetical protein